MIFLLRVQVQGQTEQSRIQPQRCIRAYVYISLRKDCVYALWDLSLSSVLGAVCWLLSSAQRSGGDRIFLLNSRLKEMAEPAHRSFLWQSKGDSTHSELLAAPHPGLTNPWSWRRLSLWPGWARWRLCICTSPLLTGFPLPRKESAWPFSFNIIKIIRPGIRTVKTWETFFFLFNSPGCVNRMRRGMWLWAEGIWWDVCARVPTQPPPFNTTTPCCSRVDNRRLFQVF